MQILRFAFRGFACCGLIVACLLDGVATGQSIGRWRMPSTPAQFFGYGVGPGHHAPIVRAPAYHPPRVRRITRPACRHEPFCREAGVFYGCQPRLPMHSPSPVVPVEAVAPAGMPAAHPTAPILAPIPAVETSNYRPQMFAPPSVGMASR